MAAYAQTIFQLYAQLRQAGAADDELVLVHRGNELASEIFAGRYQASGKVFIAHVVGTASILVARGVPVTLVAAALLHNAYRNGDFGDGRDGPVSSHRREVRDAVGEAAERVIERFATLQWNPQAIAALQARAAAIDPLDHDVVLLRLADQLEHLLHGEARYECNQGTFRYLDRAPATIALAERLGEHGLAAEIAAGLEATRATLGVDDPGTTRPRVVPPAAYHLRPRIRLRRALGSLRRRLGHR